MVLVPQPYHIDFNGGEQPDDRLRQIFGDQIHQGPSLEEQKQVKLSQQKIRRREGKSYLFSQEARERRDMIAASYIDERRKAHDKCMDEAEKAFEKF